MLWIKLRRLRPSSEKGQTLILVAVVFVALLGMGAMAVDVGGVLWSRGAEQNIADAAALAGVRDLPGDPTGAVALATTYAQSNYPAGEPITVSAVVSSQADGASFSYANSVITVEIHRLMQPWLRAAVGGSAIDVPARAQAIVTTVQPNCNVYPFVIQSPMGSSSPIYQQYGTEVTLKYDTTQSSGNYGLLQVTARHGANDVRSVIASGGYCPANVDSLNLDQGQRTGPVQQGWDQLVATVDPTPYPSPSSAWPLWTFGIPDNVYWDTNSTSTPPWGLGCIPSNQSCGCNGPTMGDPRPAVDVGSCPRVGFIPIIDQWPSSGNSQPVAPYDWAAFYIISVTDNGKTVTGSFLKNVVVTGGTATWTDPNSSSLLGYFLWK